MHPLRVDPTNTVTPEELEAERAGEQELIDEGLSLPLLLPIVQLLTHTMLQPSPSLLRKRLRRSRSRVLDSIGTSESTRDSSEDARCTAGTSCPSRLLLIVLTLPVCRNAFEGIRIEVPTKTVEEIEAYAKVFWQRYTEIEGASLSFLSSSSPY
jgi:hypothetical protein